jgi:uncharacterized protein with PIN domain
MSVTYTASPSRTGEYTEVKKCDGCGKAFWIPRNWNNVSVKCPHCYHIH